MLCSDCIIHKSNKMWFKFMAFVFLKTTFEISIITEMNIQNRILFKSETLSFQNDFHTSNIKKENLC